MMQVGLERSSSNRSRTVTTVLLLLFAVVALFLISGLSRSSQSSPIVGDVIELPQTAQAPVLEGCVSCHSRIEPMHRYGPTGAADQLKDGKDAQGLSCTACHGGNPAAKTKDEAHVRPRFPRQWQRDGKYTGANPERTNTLLEKESSDFVRFVNPGD